MEIKKHQLVFCTQKDSSGQTLVWENIRDFGLELSYVSNNKKPLCVRYNEAIEMALETDMDCLILVHDDVILEENPIPKLEKLFDQFDLVGVAGSKKIEIKSPCLWHLMGGGFQSGNLHGIVQHLQYMKYDFSPMQGYYAKPASNFGPVPQRVLMIDGVFMALNRKCMETMRFDETNPAGFHFYDLDFSLSTHQKGLKVGVGDILITHASPGLREFTPEWISGDKWFLEKHSN